MIRRNIILSEKEKEIMERIQGVLSKHDFHYRYDKDSPDHIDMAFEIKKRPFSLYVYLQNGKVILSLIFPFRVQTNAIPLVAMFLTKFNYNKAFGHMTLDMTDGELAMDYSYILEEPDHFNEDEFMIYMMSLVHPSVEVYAKISRLAMGILPDKEILFYEPMLEMSLETICGEKNNEDISYGIEDDEQMQEKKIREYMNDMFKSEHDDKLSIMDEDDE